MENNIAKWDTLQNILVVQTTSNRQFLHDFDEPLEAPQYVPKCSGVIYDIEIVNIIQSDKSKRVGGYSYCDSWTDYKNMGVAVVVALDLQEQAWRFYTQNTLERFYDFLYDRQYHIHYNGITFDNNVLDSSVSPATTLFRAAGHQVDLLRWLWSENGLTDHYVKDTHSGYGLADVARVNNLGSKGNSTNVPSMWQEGFHTEILQHCMRDVHLTALTLGKALDGTLLDPKRLKPLSKLVLENFC